MTPPAGQGSLGELLRQARISKGISKESLVRELRLPMHLLNAMESDDWKQFPPGRERPLARLVAQKVGLDLDACPEAFQGLPGGVEQDAPDPRRESLERMLMGAISLSSIALLAWLVIPGRGLRSKVVPVEPAPVQTASAPLPPAQPMGPFPVLGEVLPEPPITEEGIRVNLRAIDTCEAEITNAGGVLKQSLHVSEPWKLRVKGPFTLSLDNAGVVEVEVAGRRINHGRIVGESWTGTFEADGSLQLPPKPKTEIPPTAPETEPEAESTE
jgi:hypothetical protein